MTGSGGIPEVVMDMLKKKDTAGPIAVVGASSNPEKYGNIIVANLTGKGYAVVPVNPKEAEINGLPSVAGVSELPGDTALVVFVVPPKVTLGILHELAKTDIQAVWFQDGSFDEKVLAFAEVRFPYVVHHACIMVVTNLVT
jgi:hypothetical protein